MPEEMADGGRKLVTLDDLIDALDKRERAPSNAPKVETFHVKGDRVCEWMDLTEQALVGLSDEVKLQRVLRYVLHSHHREVTKVVDAAGGSWTKFGDLMRRKYRLGDGLLTMADLEAMNKEDFSTIRAFLHEFKKKARKVHGISEEAQCAIFLGLLTGSEATELTKYGEGSERLTWATIDKGVEEGSLDQVEQHQMRLQRRKRKERDATVSGTPGVKRIVTDVLAALGYDNEAEIQKRGVPMAQGRVLGAVDEEAGQEDYGGGETVRLEEGFDVERMVDKLPEDHNDLMNLKDILASAPRLHGELKGWLSRRLVANVHLSSILPREIEWTEAGTRMDLKCVACGLVDLKVRDQPSIAMVDTGAKMNIIRERDATMLGLEVDHSDHGVLHDANCKAIFCGTTSNVMVEIGRVRARTCFFVMPDVDHPILLGRSFLCRTETLVFNRHEGTMILALSDPACGNYEIIKCQNTGPGNARNRLNLGSFTFEGSEYARRRLREEQEEEGAGEVLSLSLNDVNNKAMEVVTAHDMADPEAIKALREQVLESPQGNFSQRSAASSEEGELLIPEGDIREAFRAEEYDGIYPELGLLLSCEMRDRDASAKVQKIRHLYVVRDDHLFIKRQVGNPKRIVCGRNRQIDVIAALHDGIAGGHRGVSATCAKISEFYNWDGMLTMVIKYCQSCVTCQQRSAQRPRKPLHPRLEREVGAVVHVDLLFMPLGEDGSNYIFDARDNLTGFVDGRAIRTKTGPVLARSDFSKAVMQRGGRDTWPRQGPQRMEGRGEQNEPPRREPTPEFDDDNIELCLDVYWDHAAQRRWSVAERIHHLRGIGRFEEPVAQICEEALTWPDVEARMQRLRASPRGRDGMPIRLEEGNVDEFIPAYEHYMLSLGVAQGEWVQALLIWTRRAEKQAVKQIQERARDWEDCQAQLRRAFGRPQHERHEPRVERQWRSKRPREPAPREAGLAREGRGASAQREDEPVEAALARESFPACGLRAVEFRRITSEGLRPPLPLPSTQELDIPRETPFRSLATHLDVSQWEASRLGGGSVEPACDVLLEEPLDPEMETDMRDREEPHDPEMAAERPDPVRPQGREVITVGDDTPPCSPAPESAQHSWPEGIPDPGGEEIPEFPPEATAIPEQEAEAENQGVCERARMEAPLDLPSATQATKSLDIEEPVSAELPPVVPRASIGMEAEASTPGDQGPRMGGTPRETREEKQAEMEAAGIKPTPPVEPKTSEQRIDELWARYESQRDAARQRSREAGQADEEMSELREMGDLGFSATRQAIERMDRRVCATTVTSFQWYYLLSNELRVKELEVEHLTTQLAEERARSQAREVEWERRFGEMTAAVDRLSVAWEASQMGRAGADGEGRAGADGEGRGVQASPGQGAAVEVPRQAEPMEEAPLDAVEEEGGAQESLMAMFTERRGSRLHELATTIGIGTPQEGPQGLDAPEHVPRLGELRAELGSWATETDSGGPDSRQQQQQQEVMSEPTTMVGPQPSELCGDEVVVEIERAHEEGPRELDMPDDRPGSTVARRGGGAEAMEPGPQGHMGSSSCHEVTTGTMETPSASSSQGRKKKTARWHDTSCFWCKEGGHRAVDRPELLEDKAEGRVAEVDDKFYDRQGRVVERAPDGGVAQLYRQNREELCK
ncbi:hypothetical protein CBR_g49689 [Chara braunii]|uniref:Integrase zinc-binding domain-containing protein n=1 Tax=Chara braunii TaxID=69332 RepID=A0A388M5M4_CHABU|nr:hypothetical protein CBR_g49689 [Chara braunii]|eukprot:GBG89840.1 hypothetical protein CBR_g49689 [Chara braunii]